MILSFFDESKPQPDNPYYHIGAICINETDTLAIEEEMAAIAFDVFGDSQLCLATEFHAVDIYHGSKYFKKMTNPIERVAILEKFIKLLSKKEVGLIDIQINKSKLSVGQNAADIAFMFLCEKVNDFVRSQNSIGILIGDRESDRMSERFSTDLSKYRANGTDFAFGRSIENLFESVHFTHSHLSRFLQLADIYTWLLQFRNKENNLTNPKHSLLLNVLQQKDINLFPSRYKEWPKSK